MLQSLPRYHDLNLGKAEALSSRIIQAFISKLIDRIKSKDVKFLSEKTFVCEIIKVVEMVMSHNWCWTVVESRFNRVCKISVG